MGAGEKETQEKQIFTQKIKIKIQTCVCVCVCVCVLLYAKMYIKM